MSQHVPPGMFTCEFVKGKEMEKIGPHLAGGGGLVKRSIICLSEIIFYSHPHTSGKCEAA